jgi:receptor expression-enhancing protein 5/6
MAAMSENESDIDTVLGRSRILVFLEAKLHIPRVAVLIFLVLLSLLLLLLYFGVQRCCNFIAFVYPAFMTYKTLEGDSTDEHLYWLMYWAVYASFFVVETVADYFFFWIPSYYHLKFLLLMSCFMPQTRGAEVVYRRALKPVLGFLRPYIEETVVKTNEVALQATNELKAVGSDIISDLKDSMVQKVTQAVVQATILPSISEAAASSAELKALPNASAKKGGSEPAASSAELTGLPETPAKKVKAKKTS